eukprot:CAMPEP_0177683466 /NCGR_PEP_ID=MMETSP0447-20121125/31819_1 /TAXON_ID=0 /ORGANISM="Stygamoeba regulata, Strain BSH-02190019" /LENGTH=79 /DNA_ID=CAMNT_0019193061 /DNA_START=189 /DNA_END=425 /DNA_ORIENTATION=-
MSLRDKRELLCTYNMAEVEEMAYEDAVNETDREFTFSFRIKSHGTVKLSAFDDKERQHWYQMLRDVVPRAKMEKAQQIL